jgi:aspartyl-tRNA(Asn)/glutamyl-tRNA(Gln) amidotransferase subunit A
MTVAPDLDIVTAGRLLRAGELSARDLTAACLARIEQLNASLRAFITVTTDEALEAAAAADAELSAGHDRGPLHGIPISIKDLVHQRGTPTTAASRVLDGGPAEADAPLTARLRRAGAILVGKTNLHEFAMGTLSDESAFGAVRHPLDPSRSPGGSSGGSAVAVATGMSLASIGTDTGGSIRIPAAACGLVGLKPAYGEVPTEGVIPLSRTLDHAGPLTRSVADAALVYSALVDQPVPASPSPARLPGRRVGVLVGYFTDRLDRGVRAAFDRACGRLSAAGATLADVTLQHADTIAAIYFGILFPEAAAYHAAALEVRGHRYIPAIRQQLEAGRFVTGEDYVRAMIGRDAIRAAVERLLESHDALLLPGMAITAPTIGTATVLIDGTAEPVRNLMLRLTQPFNISGHPAIVIPSGTDERGLPCSVQLVGRSTQELLAFALSCEPHIRGGVG